MPTIAPIRLIPASPRIRHRAGRIWPRTSSRHALGLVGFRSLAVNGRRRSRGSATALAAAEDWPSLAPPITQGDDPVPKGAVAGERLCSPSSLIFPFYGFADADRRGRSPGRRRTPAVDYDAPTGWSIGTSLPGPCHCSGRRRSPAHHAPSVIFRSFSGFPVDAARSGRGPSRLASAATASPDKADRRSRVCRRLSQIAVAVRWMAARKLRTVLS